MNKIRAMIVARKFKRYIGKDIIRIAPAKGDNSYQREYYTLLSITEKGEMKVMTRQGRIWILQTKFSDSNWILYEEALVAKDNILNEWKGRRIKRNKPVFFDLNGQIDVSYMKESVILISASKHHLVVELDDGKKWLLPPYFADPHDWELVDTAELS